MLFHIIIMYALLFGMMAAPSLMYLFLIYVFGSLVPSWAVTVRRMHDTGKSGWYMFIPIYSFILTCTNGEEGKNEYGDDPKNPGDAIEEIGTAQE